MFSIAKKIVIGLLMITASTSVIWAISPSNNPEEALIERFQPADDTRLTSARYSQPDDLSVVDPLLWIPFKDTDELLLSNPQFNVYLNRDTLAFKIEDVRSGYIWNTVIDDVNAGTFDSLLSSSIGFEFININQNFSLRQNVGINDTEYTYDLTVSDNQILIDIEIGGFCTSRQCSRFYDEYVAGNPSYDLERMLTLGFVNLDFSFQVVMTLDAKGLNVHVPFASIEEGNAENVVLSSLMIFPGLGATTDEMPGYMVIPDGAGALIRYGSNEENTVAPYEERFYGRNLGIISGRSSVTNYPLTLPIFGVVHGVYQHGFIGMIESGDLNATLLAYPQGASNLPYYLIFPRFDLKQTYRQSFTSDGLGGSLKIHESGQEDITLRYDFLEGQDAHYVGMGLNYQDYLKEQGTFDVPLSNHADIPVHLQFLMADSRSRFIGKEVIVMTDLESASSMHRALLEQGITNQRISLKGWNDGGYSGQLPSALHFESRLGSRSDLRNIESLFETSYPLMLVNNYNYASEATDRINYRRDVALGVNRFRLERTCSTCVYTQEYFLTPERTQTLALNDLEDYQDSSVNVLFESLGHTLFSYDFNGPKTRLDAFNQYQEVMQAYQDIAQYNYPFPYVWDYTDSFFEAPLYNSQLKYFNDVVPLLSIVLSGQMEQYGQFLNFNSLGRSQLLRLIDFNIYPSYVLTEARPSDLKGSDLESMFATEFRLFEELIVEEYSLINEALSQVIGARIIKRDVLLHGVVKVTYDNGVRIYINYGFDDVTVDDKTILGQNIFVEGASS